MMRAVWSFWSAPYRAHYHRFWLDERYHLLSWILSVMQGSRHYPDARLIADSAGAEILIDALKLPFRSVEITLDTLNAARNDS